MATLENLYSMSRYLYFDGRSFPFRFLQLLNYEIMY